MFFTFFFSLHEFLTDFDTFLEQNSESQVVMKPKIETIKLNNFVNSNLNKNSEVKDVESQNQNSNDFKEDIIELTKLLADLKQCLCFEDCNRFNIPEPTILITNTDDEVFNPEQVIIIFLLSQITI